MQCGEPVPNHDSICGMAVVNLIKNRSGVSFTHGREHAINDQIDVRFCAQGTGKRFGSTLRFLFYGLAHLEKSRVQISLAQEKIRVAPGDFSGKGINAFRLEKSVARSRSVSLRFVDGSHICPKIRRMRIKRQRHVVRLEGSRRVRFLQVVLPITAEKEPVLKIARLQACGPLVTLTGFEAGVVSGEGVANAEVEKQQERDKSKSEDDCALFGIERKLTHPRVLCLDRFAVARQNSTEALEKDSPKRSEKCICSRRTKLPQHRANSKMQFQPEGNSKLRNRSPFLMGHARESSALARERPPFERQTTGPCLEG